MMVTCEESHETNMAKVVLKITDELPRFHARQMAKDCKQIRDIVNCPYFIALGVLKKALIEIKENNEYVCGGTLVPFNTEICRTLTLWNN